MKINSLRASTLSTKANQEASHNNTESPTESSVIDDTVEIVGDLEKKGYLPEGITVGLKASNEEGKVLKHIAPKALKSTSLNLATSFIAMIGALPAASSSVVTANLTTNRTKGALIGGFVGTGVGLLQRKLFGRSHKMMVLSIGISSTSGIMGGIAGSKLALKQKTK